MITLHIDIKESSTDKIKELAGMIVRKTSQLKFDVQTGGLLYDLLIGCGLSSEEIWNAGCESKKLEQHKEENICVNLDEITKMVISESKDFEYDLLCNDNKESPLEFKDRMCNQVRLKYKEAMDNVKETV